MRKKIVAGNWKMNNDEYSSKKLTFDFLKYSFKLFPIMLPVKAVSVAAPSDKDNPRTNDKSKSFISNDFGLETS